MKYKTWSSFDKIFIKDVIKLEKKKDTDFCMRENPADRKNRICHCSEASVIPAVTLRRTETDMKGQRNETRSPKTVNTTKLNQELLSFSTRRDPPPTHKGEQNLRFR